MTPVFRLALALLAFAGCATPPPPRPAVDWRTLPPLPRSSIAAVLDHAAELKLDDAQQARLQAADEALAARIETLREEHRARREAEEKARPAAAGPHAGGPAQQGMPGGRAPGMGSGGARGWGGARRGQGPGAEGGASGGAHGRPPLGPQFDDLDTAAMLEVEGVFTPAQHDPAMTWASKFRESLYERRALIRQARGADDADAAP